MQKRVLIVEDEILIQQSLKKLLEKKGASVDVESSGKKAIEAILSRSYDKVLCDLMLNDIHGFDIIEDSKKKYSANPRRGKRYIEKTSSAL